MRPLSAGLIYVAVSTAAAVLLAEIAGRLNPGVSLFSLMTGATAALATFFLMPPAPPRPPVGSRIDDPFSNFGFIWFCLVGFVFSLFAIGSFCCFFFFVGVIFNFFYNF